jgi:predicted amidohydrolase YtcJ
MIKAFAVGTARALALAATVTWAFACARPATEPADTIFVGQFLTLAPEQPTASALAVRGGRILAVGTDAELAGHVGPATTRVAVPGVALPGLADAHVHALGLGAQLEMLDLRGLAKAEILSRVEALARESAPGDWIQGRGWDQGFWTPEEFPTAAELDRAAPNHPVILTRIDGHSVWVNSSALRKAGVTRATRDPEGGRFLRLPDGTPSGTVVDNAVDLVTAAVPTPTPAQNERRLKAALQQYVRWGLTSVHDAGVGLETIGIYKALLARGELPLRVYVMASGTGPTAEHYLTAGPERLGDGRLVVRSFKVLLDGALGSRGAQLLAPYSDAPDQSGLVLMQDEDLRQLVSRAAARGFQVNAHAIGDRAIRRALDAFESLGPSLADRRFRIEHVSIVHDDDLPRLATLGVIASMQPNFVGEYSRWAVDRVGAARIRTVYRTADLLESGAIVAAGTDYPAADSGDPIVTLFSMVTRKGADGAPEGGWYPDQMVSVSDTLRAMTWAPAYAAFEEQERGALTPGRLADFTAVSGDPTTTAPDHLRSLRTQMTVVGGRVVFRR